ncbi:Glutathione-dependent formaldehyde-activating enzyme/centromere protein V [Mycena kentingensis (nom. inval.)]|nr:Glutathione-dependent formaldehyde-activating enzyme/centromere protein V [Mycena kentingensis (nom. inval.)]
MSNEENTHGDSKATATCFCGAVQLSFPTEGPGFVNSFICHCKDCRKITASFFSSIFTIADTHLTHVRGQANLQTYSDPKARTIASGHAMTNYFCATCGSLMYRVGAQFPGYSFLRLGTVDDYGKYEERLRPQREQFTKDRGDFLLPLEGLKQFEASMRL